MSVTWSPCSDLQTRETKWVSSAWNAKNGDGRPASCVSWGVSAVSVAASCRQDR